MNSCGICTLCAFLYTVLCLWGGAFGRWLLAKHPVPKMSLTYQSTVWCNLRQSLYTAAHGRISCSPYLTFPIMIVINFTHCFLLSVYNIPDCHTSFFSPLWARVEWTEILLLCKHKRILCWVFPLVVFSPFLKRVFSHQIHQQQQMGQCWSPHVCGAQQRWWLLGAAAYQLGNTSSRTITEVKQCWAWLVLEWEAV